ncbi:FAD:protein FMN transferase [Paenibacillus sp. FA6]|uniref:FAD:protein FMN transferase n=1 Tax=Paenibacillus sp. FA6 TaxID=3413029 RepID=UPI003F65C16A
MKPFKHAPLLLMLCLMIALSGCGNSKSSSNSKIEPVSKSFYVFDTIVQVRVYDDKTTEKNFDDIQNILDTIEIQMNRSNDKSEVADVNRNAGVKPVQVSEDTFHVISAAYEYSERSEGRFNMAIGPLVSLWNIGNEGAKVPPTDKINEAIQLSNYKNVELYPDKREVYLTEKGMSLDLGSIAKGFAADKIVEYLQAEEFNSAIVDLGGNVFAMGKKPGDKLWTIGIQDPDETRGNPIGNIHVDNMTIVTSGVYERYFVENGKHYHHILDSKSGFPVENNINSVTILTDKSIDADGLSTALFALGIEKGLAFIESLEHTDALFITKDKQIIASSGIRDLLTITNDNYTLVTEEEQ